MMQLALDGRRTYMGHEQLQDAALGEAATT